MTRFTVGSLELYLIIDPDIAAGKVVSSAAAAVRHGVTCLQLRWKSGSDREFARLARQLMTIATDSGVPLIINDRTDIALVVGAMGVHLGVDDLPIGDARRLAGPDFVIGYSPATDAGIEQAAQAGASYLGIGPYFGTSSKWDAGSALGPAEFRRRRDLTDLPVVAIGGIDAVNAWQPLKAGADGVAVASAILGSQDPASATHLLKSAVRTVRR